MAIGIQIIKQGQLTIVEPDFSAYLCLSFSFTDIKKI